MSARSGPAPICLLDVVATDGTSYHWANKEVDVPPVYTGTQPAWAASLAHPPANYDTHYFPWLLSASGFHDTRAAQSDQATLQIQNISGNTLQRDLAGLLTARTFEGALAAFREYNLLAQAAEYEQHGRLTVMGPSEDQCQFGMAQLVNPNDYDGNPYSYSETCQWRYASPGCGDATANPCDNTYVTCRQHLRFLGILNNVVFPGPGVAMVSANQVQYRRLF